MKESYDIAIIGGGAAGLMAAAVIARESGAKKPRTVVLEQGSRLGRKLLATGNGRCNLYNLNLSPQRYLSEHPAALKQGVQAVLDLDELSLWRELGMLTQADQEGRVYPACHQAAAVLELLGTVAAGGGVELLCGCSVERVSKQRQFLLTLADGSAIRARQVILAAGGKAAPSLGSAGRGYDLARQLGHTVTDLRPGLVPVRCVNPSKTLKGVRETCGVALYQGQRLVERRDGQVQFTEYGLSGIVIMQLSNYMEAGKGYSLELDLFPLMEEAELWGFFRQKRRDNPGQKAEFLLLGVLKIQFAQLLLRSCRVDGKKRALGSLTDQELAAVAARVKHWRVQVRGLLPWEQAQVTCGGVRLNEVDMGTFQSKKVPGLYLAGELLDAAGDCGGFNLAWAFGTGVLAARATL